MFKAIQKIGEAIRDSTAKTTINPAIFNDPLALQTDWSPASPGGSNFKTHKLHEVGVQRMEFRATIGMILFSGLFLVVGLGVMAIAPGRLWIYGEPFANDMIFLLIFGLLFAGAGGYMMYSALTPTVFDKGHGYFCKNRLKPEHTFTVVDIKNHVPLTRIHAIQLISERVSSSGSRGRSSSYKSHELNLVLDDGTRLNVVDHGCVTTLRADAQRLAAFLGKPIWDAT
ncbi:MAG: hypothetical protein ACNA8L_08585 [Luteolibacter sp.]|jgi:hypothetical protein